jgi:ribosome-associated protein
MDIRKLQRAIVDGLEDVKAQDIAVFNTEALSPLFERVIIASGTSNRQTKALASSVRETVKARGLPVLRTEGEDNGEWIIVDCGAAVAHIMQPTVREYYRLEEIWGGKAVRMKRAEAKVGLPKASEPAAPAAPAPTAAKTARQASPARRSAAGPGGPTTRGNGVKTAGPPGGRASTRKTVAAKAPARKAVAGKTAPRKTASPRAPVRKATARKPSL